MSPSKGFHKSMETKRMNPRGNNGGNFWTWEVVKNAPQTILATWNAFIIVAIKFP